MDKKLLNDETESHVIDTDIIISNKYDKTYENEMDKVIDRLTDER